MVRKKMVRRKDVLNIECAQQANNISNTETTIAQTVNSIVSHIEEQEITNTLNSMVSNIQEAEANLWSNHRPESLNNKLNADAETSKVKKNDDEITIANGPISTDINAINKNDKSNESSGMNIKYTAIESNESTATMSKQTKTNENIGEKTTSTTTAATPPPPPTTTTTTTMMMTASTSNVTTTTTTNVNNTSKSSILENNNVEKLNDNVEKLKPTDNAQQKLAKELCLNPKNSTDCVQNDPTTKVTSTTFSTSNSNKRMLDVETSNTDNTNDGGENKIVKKRKIDDPDNNENNKNDTGLLKQNVFDMSNDNNIMNNDITVTDSVLKTNDTQDATLYNGIYETTSKGFDSNMLLPPQESLANVNNNNNDDSTKKTDGSAERIAQQQFDQQEQYQQTQILQKQVMQQKELMVKTKPQKVPPAEGPLEVVVPKNFTSGDQLTVEDPRDKKRYLIRIPQNASEGSILHINVNMVGGSTIQPQQSGVPLQQVVSQQTTPQIPLQQVPMQQIPLQQMPSQQVPQNVPNKQLMYLQAFLQQQQRQQMQHQQLQQQQSQFLARQAMSKIFPNIAPISTLFIGSFSSSQKHINFQHEDGRLHTLKILLNMYGISFDAVRTAEALRGVCPGGTTCNLDEIDVALNSTFDNLTFKLSGISLSLIKQSGGGDNFADLISAIIAHDVAVMECPAESPMKGKQCHLLPPPCALSTELLYDIKQNIIAKRVFFKGRIKAISLLEAIEASNAFNNNNLNFMSNIYGSNVGTTESNKKSGKINSIESKTAKTAQILVMEKKDKLISELRKKLALEQEEVKKQKRLNDSIMQENYLLRSEIARLRQGSSLIK